jgi:hypothetical protein
MSPRQFRRSFADIFSPAVGIVDALFEGVRWMTMRKKIVLFLSMLMLVGATAVTQGCFVGHPNDGYSYNYNGSGRWYADNSHTSWRGWNQSHRHYSCDRYGNNCTEY